jgi:cytoskeletal protein CcmA (bactofilin family)
MALFGKTEEKTANTTVAPVTRREENRVQRSGGEVLETLIGKGSEFDGKLTFEGQVHIEGKFTGQIHTKDTLIVGQSARVQAEIIAGTVIVKGVIEGNIKAVQLIELHASGRIKGNVETPAFSIERGGTFEGSSKMENLSKGAAPAAPTPIEAAKK